MVKMSAKTKKIEEIVKFVYWRERLHEMVTDLNKKKLSPAKKKMYMELVTIMDKLDVQKMLKKLV